MSDVTPNGLEHFLLGKWEPCKKKHYTELGAKVALSHIKSRRKFKYNKKRRETRAYYCAECLCYHLTSIK